MKTHAYEVGGFFCSVPKLFGASSKVPFRGQPDWIERITCKHCLKYIMQNTSVMTIEEARRAGIQLLKLRLTNPTSAVDKAAVRVANLVAEGITKIHAGDHAGKELLSNIRELQAPNK